VDGIEQTYQELEIDMDVEVELNTDITMHGIVLWLRMALHKQAAPN
jgi:hypothetical protein